ncbi:MAG: response regulator transcription factor [Burkholderiales bacterium]|nr:response regulator transcription factor [Burkholderiales bacterium]
MKILVVDDHPLILEGLHHVLKLLDGDVRVLDAQTDDARRLAQAHPDAVLMLLGLTPPDEHGFALLGDLRSRYPGIPVVVLSSSDGRAEIVRAMDFGAAGFIPKRASKELIVSALRLVLMGGVYVPRARFEETASESRAPTAGRTAAANRSSTTPRDLGLTDRQAQVLALVLEGKPNKVICRELRLAEGTVKIHVAAILRALNVGTRTQAVIEAARLGLTFDGTALHADPPARSHSG